MRNGRALLLVALLLAACERDRRDLPSHAARAATPGPRLDMAVLHRTGGVPPRWRFAVPPGDAEAGRRAFADLGCPSCHRVEGERFDAATGSGPDLTGMGSHHPPEYFAESILNPDAVLVDGPGYIGSDGRSIMPTYPDLTAAQLADLVAYLKSLRAGAGAEALAAAEPIARPGDLPAPPAQPGTVFYVMVYDVQPGQLAAFVEWFANEGRRAFLAEDGVASVETWVDTSREGPPLATVIGFRDDAALKRFLDDPSAAELGTRFDSFIGPHAHRVYRRLPVYRVDALSAVPAG
jgi:mono/diheme cytochrome c family protein